jgi:hypothetical protein
LGFALVDVGAIDTCAFLEALLTLTHRAASSDSTFGVGTGAADVGTRVAFVAAEAISGIPLIALTSKAFR